ncbi:PucR family transcriptional regulator [Streptomyces sp. NPDC056347]|uniref:PucR family transcriptional regulator n=1 Tax=Streptomyces sp. NPDC056347 TaxID=3345790 RepID=UPI0035E066ED
MRMPTHEPDRDDTEADAEADAEADTDTDTDTDTEAGFDSSTADTDTGTGSGTSPGPSLGQLLALVAPGTLDVVVAPRSTSIPVTGVALHDPGEEPLPYGTAGLVLLAVGVELGSPGAVDVLRAADLTGATAVVMRRGGRDPGPELLEAAALGRTALLSRRPERGWTEVLGRLRTALASHRAPSGTRGTDSPVVGLRPGDLSGLANTVADLVGGAITIEDPQSRVLAYSRLDHEPDPMRRLTILGQEVPRWRVAELRESGFLQTLWSTDDVVRLPADGRYAERLAVAVREGSEVLGTLWAAPDGRPLTEDAADALRTAARAAVPHLAHHRTWGRAAAGAREEAVHALLRGNVGAAPEAGVAADRPYAVVVAEAGTGAGGPDGRRVLDVLALRAAADRPGCATAHSGRRLYVLVPAGDGERDPARALLAAARSVTRCAVFAGAGPVAAGPAELPASREAAELVVRALRERAARTADGGAVSAAAAHHEVVARTSALRLLDRLEPLWGALSGPVHAMVEHDRTHGSAYGASVAAYLDASCDAGAAARRLHVHPNTLRYRLRRARELFGVDPADPDVRLLAEIGLRLAARPKHPPRPG